MNLSANFTLEEMVRSQTALRNGIDNMPPPVLIENGKRLCSMLLEPARAQLCQVYGQQVTMHTDSGYRCPKLNKAANGSSTSAHMNFLAADEIPALPNGVTLREAFDLLRKNPFLPYDQIIYEFGEWIHFGISAFGKPCRHQALIATKVPGLLGIGSKTVYTVVKE